jgi:hypothetical protein
MLHALPHEAAALAALGLFVMAVGLWAGILTGAV